jgi:4-diphosphocytidyl-2-C-methyl-D-erythritol kinase
MESTSIVVSAPAKLNLLLNVLGKRADNYHQLETLFQSIDLCDQLEFSFAQSEDLEIRLAEVSGTAGNDFPLDASNLIYRSIAKFIERLENKPKIAIDIKVTKNIPIGAGLAGGSANAAATLLALNSYFADCFSSIELGEIAAELGSDVPFSLVGGTSIGRGKGDELEHIAFEGEIDFIIVKPRDIAIASSWAYSAFDENTALQPEQHIELPANRSKQTRVAQVISYLADKSIAQASQMFGNDLESTVFKFHPVLKEVQDSLLEEGCISAHMTGSGSTVYGVLKDEAQGADILKSFARKQDSWAEQKNFIVDSWLTKSLNHGVRISNNSVMLSSGEREKIR